MITDFVEGQSPQQLRPGNCFFMPDNTQMPAANLGEEPVELIDILVLPEGEPTMTVIEKDKQSKYENKTKNKSAI